MFLYDMEACLSLQRFPGGRRRGFSSMEAGEEMKHARRYPSGAWKMGDLEKIFDREASWLVVLGGTIHRRRYLLGGGGDVGAVN